MACHKHTINGASRGTPPVPPHEPFAKRSLTYTLAVLIQTLQRTCALCSVQWFIIQASERARLSQKRDRAKKESTCATSLRPTLLRTPRAICTSSNENSIIEESRRLREKSVSSSGKVRSYTSHLGFFGSNIARSCQNFCNVAF